MSFDTNNSATNTLRVDGNISNVSTLQFTGGTDANDIVDINADIAAASIEIQDVHNVLIDASVSRNLTAMDGNVSVLSSTGEIQFDNGVSTVAINSMGGSVQLSDVDTQGSDLTIDSKSNVTLANIELNDSGAISVAFDTDNNEAAFLQLDGEIRNATSVTFAAGGTGTDDRINVAGNIDADAGDIDFGNASVVSIDASAARSINAEAGSVLLNSVGTIELTGGSQLISMIAEQDVRLLTDVSDVGGNAIAERSKSGNVQAGDNVNLKSVSLDGTTTDGSLTVSFDTNNSATNTLRVDGNISNVSTLQFTGGTDANDIVDINADIAAASIEIQDVHNVLIDASVSRNLTAMDGNVSVLSSTGEIQFDNGVSTVAINSMGGSVQLSDVDTQGSNLTIDSKSNVTLANIELNDSGAISVAFDTDNNEAAFLQLDGEIRNATSVTFAAGGTGTDDRINVAGNIDADAGDIDFGNASVVSIDALAARSINAEAGSVLLNSVGTIELTGGSQLISMIAQQDVRLSDVATAGALVNGASLNVQAGENVNLKSVSLDGTTADGTLTVSFDTNNSATNTLRVDGNISNVSTLQFTGGTDANDIVDINADIAAASIEIQDVHNVLIDASVSRNLTAMDGNVSVLSSTGEIQFDNGVSTVAINSMGGSVQLSDVDTQGSNLTIDSKSNVTLANIELNDSGAISVAFDTDNNEAAFLQLDGEIRNATSVTFAAGGTGTDDRINVAGNIDADAGDIDFGNASVVSIDALAARSINAEAGSVLLNSVGTIELTGGSQLISMIAQQDVRLSDVATAGALGGTERSLETFKPVKM